MSKSKEIKKKDKKKYILLHHYQWYALKVFSVDIVDKKEVD